jgi:hypothetical protein
MIDLGKRAVACKHWSWMPGMLVCYGYGESWYRLTDGDGYGRPFKYIPPNPRDAWPDLDDAATVGCLLALVRRAWNDSRVHCRGRANKFRAYSGVTAVGDWVFTEAAALVAALEAAP